MTNSDKETHVAEQYVPSLARITPQMAERWLQNQIRNRPIRRSRVDQIKGDIASSRWDHSVCNPIKFNSVGQLVDGQHRLTAIAAAGISVLCWVQHGVDSIHIDDNASRRVSDIIEMTGICDGSRGRTYQSVVYLIERVQRIRDMNAEFTANTCKLTAMSVEESIRMIAQISGFAKIVADARWLYGKQPRMAKTFTASTAGAMLHFAEDDCGMYAEAREFMASIAVGEGLRRGQPELAYRNWAQSTPSSMRNRVEIAAMFYAFRKAIAGEDCVMIRNSHIGDVSRLASGKTER